jgi:hypothetical protein
MELMIISIKIKIITTIDIGRDFISLCFSIQGSSSLGMFGGHEDLLSNVLFGLLARLD